MSSLHSTRFFALVAIFASFLFTSCQKESISPETPLEISARANSNEGKTIAQIISSDPSFRFMKQAVTKGGWMNELGQVQNVILFAPVNSAFQVQFNISNANEILKANPTPMHDLMSYHVVTGANEINYFRSNIWDSWKVLPNYLNDNLQAIKLPANPVSGEQQIGILDGMNFNHQTFGKPIIASNGVIFTIDGVLLPSNNLAATVFSN
jgi:uncharacterized surface protein with fasciclin (FAS1) repeats